MLRAWRSLSGLLEGSRRLVGASLALSLGQSLALVPIAFVVRRAFDVTIPEGDAAGMIGLGALIMALLLLSSAFGLTTRWLALRATKRAITLLRGRLLDRVLALPRSYLDRSDLGTLHSTLVQDTERLDVMANALVAQVMPSAIILTALSATLFVLDPLLAALLLCVVPVLLLAGRLLGRRVRGRTREWQGVFDRFSSGFLQTLRAATLIKLHGAEPAECERRSPEIAELGEVSRSMAWWQSFYQQAQGLISALAGVVVLVVGGAAVAEGRLSLGDLVSFYAVLGLLRNQFGIALGAVPQVLSGSESQARLQRILDEPAREPYSGRRRIAFSGAVELREVGFAYREGEPVLDGFELAIEPREIVALLGPNGAGKSTVISLVAALYRPQRGELLADGVPYAELAITELRRAMGVVVQNPLILPASVRQNLLFGRPGADAAEVELACRRAGAAEFIAELPDGLETRVGDEGVLLSGGQRQRLAIARALIGRPRLLMLDEPTTHLDQQGTQLLLRSLAEAEEGPEPPAIVVVSHDPAVASGVDRTVAIEAGRTCADSATLGGGMTARAAGSGG